MKFNLQSDYKPMGDQPKAIEKLTEGILRGEKYQTLLGVTGSGKTFTIANLVQNIQRPTIILAHNKTLAAQLFMEFKEFFPNNAVEYFVSYYDYYQPEAYIASTGTYIEKDLSINEEVEIEALGYCKFALWSKRCSYSCVGIVYLWYREPYGVPQIFDRNCFGRQNYSYTPLAKISRSSL